jgi:hypothetical protein
MSFFSAGTVIAVSAGPITHVGVATDQDTVITNSKGHGFVCEQSIDEFSDGRPVKMVGYPGSLQPVEVLRRARSLIGTRYNLLNFNCEHFAWWAHGLRPTSPQIWIAGIIGLTVLLFVIFRAK